MASTSRCTSSSSEESELPPVLKKRKKTYVQKYQPKWEEDDRFKGWLTKSKKGNTFCYCKACNKDLLCGKSEIEKHAKGKKHQFNARSTIQQQTLLSMPSLQQQTALKRKVKEAEIRIATFAIEHNISFNALDHLAKLNKEIYSDSEIAKMVTCGRTKATAIINEVTGKYCFEEVVTLIKKNKFSLIVDESTDQGDTKHLAMVVRVLNHDLKLVTDLFLGLLQVPSATADALYNSIKTFFIENNIPYKTNMIGFAADGRTLQ